MARKKKQLDEIQPIVYAPAVPQLITETIEKNYMPYTMSVIVSRAIPEIDGFKPAHRKILYTMYTMGLLKGQRTKSANIVGAVMKLHPHGDQSIYIKHFFLKRFLCATLFFSNYLIRNTCNLSTSNGICIGII